MSTKLSRYSEGIMEAAWIVAVIVTPVFFNIYSSRIFEPDKLTLLRSLSLVILGAWFVKLLDEGGLHRQRLEKGNNWWHTLRSVPLLLPVAALVAVYLIATIFSVSPRISWLGSYQRLQGTYTSFSYLVVFLSMAANLRRRAQVQRLITVVVLSSLPVSLYGLLQRFQLDPIPWGGDTTARIAANMGNSIFVAAYLILVFPLTLMRIVESFEALLVAPAANAAGIRWQLPDFLRSTGYVFVLALQGIALYYSNSRGPWLGWAASLVFLWLGLSLIWRKRWLTISGVAVALLGATFLIFLNIPGGPLENLRARPEFGRLGQLLDAESRTGKVRTLIWQGASELVLPHESLQYPDGTKDNWNFLRPLIGYGPESMYVAYNSFYPPELTLVEKRNASPDRSHNETWDSLVITGFLGMIVYLVLFGSVLFYGLRWLGLVQDTRQRNLFLGLYMGGGLLSTVFFLIWKGLPYLGVALPFGMVMGVIIYLILVSLFGQFPHVDTFQEKLRSYILLGLLAAVVAHFVEINFGIAIASTRTYFWSYASLLLLVGYILPRCGEFGMSDKASPSEALSGTTQIGNRNSVPEPQNPVPSSERRSKKTGDKNSAARSGTAISRRKRQVEPGLGLLNRLLPHDWQRQAMILGIILGIILMTLGFLYITNASRATNAIQTILNSMTRLDAEQVNGSSSGLVTLVLTTWLLGSILLVSETLAQVQNSMGDTTAVNIATWGKMLGLTMGVSIGLALLFWLWHASGLVALTRTPATSMEMVLDQVRQSEGILTKYYAYLFLVITGLAFLLNPDWPARTMRSSELSILSTTGILIVVIVLMTLTNLRIIQADIAFKTGDLFARPETWPVSIAVYDRARDLAPNEDYYYLFLGRAYLEYAKSINDITQRDALIQQAAQDLKKAQIINPLNTDHTANLGRLYNLWAAASTDAATRHELALEAEKYFAGAVILSPNNAKLWDEFAVLYLNVLNDPEKGFDKLNRALEIDPFYDWSYALLGDYYTRFVAVNPLLSDAQRADALQKATNAYLKAIDLVGTGELRYNYLLALGSVETQLLHFDQAIQYYLQALEISPDMTQNWRVEEEVARLYYESGDLVNALHYIQRAVAGAPEEQKERLQDLIVKYGG